MNVGSVQMATTTPGIASVTASRSSGNTGGIFGSVLAGMKKNAELANNSPASDQSGSLAETLRDILSTTDAGSLADALEELTEIPREDILSAFDKLGPSSSLDEWADVLKLDPSELMETMSTMLEEAGVSKEELAEVMYSGDLWALLSIVNDHAPELSGKLEEMLNSKDQPAKQQATNVLALLKSAETVLPTKDLLGWQQTGLAQLSDQLESLQQSIETKNAVPEVKFAALFTSSVPQSLKVPQSSQIETRSGNQSTDNQVILEKILANVTKSSQEQAPNEGKSEQNQTQLLQTATVQPIVSRNVFSLETPEARPANQSEALLAKLQGLFKQTNFGQPAGTNRLLVKLYPEQLGQVRIELLQVNGVMTARILASTALGKEMLDSQLHQLRQSFNQQNIQVDRIDVTQAAQDPSRNDRSQNFNHQQFKGNDEHPEQQENEHDEQQTFQEFLLDVEV